MSEPFIHLIGNKGKCKNICTDCLEEWQNFNHITWKRSNSLRNAWNQIKVNTSVEYTLPEKRSCMMHANFV